MDPPPPSSVPPGYILVVISDCGTYEWVSGIIRDARDIHVPWMVTSDVYYVCKKELVDMFECTLHGHERTLCVFDACEFDLHVLLRKFAPTVVFCSPSKITVPIEMQCELRFTKRVTNDTGINRCLCYKL